jgi:hypothetical protein
MKLFTPIQKVTKRELFVELPKTFFILMVCALVLATLLTSTLSQVRQTVVYYTPTAYYLKVRSVKIPDIDFTKPEDMGYVQISRTVNFDDGISADWHSEIVVVDNAGKEYCRRAGTSLLTDQANNVPVLTPVRQWIGTACTLPPGCYYQALQWAFEVDGVTKTIYINTNRFAVTTREGAGDCKRKT